MAISISFLISILLVFPSIPHLSARPSAKVKNDLLNKVCPATKNPPFCSKTLGGNPRSAGANIYGLAEISTDLTDASAWKTFGIVQSLAEKETDPELKKRYVSCNGSYNQATGYADEAKGSVIDYEDYQSMGVLSSMVNSEVFDCEEILKKPPADRSQLRKRNKILSDLSDIATTIAVMII
ncbi:hypothetical protein U1Q18_021302 [Sarracenia purpurea var. burkii]